MTDLNKLIDEGLELCERATPVETWHPENWDAVTLSWLKQSAYQDDLAFLKAAIANFKPLLLALQQFAQLRDELRCEADEADKSAGSAKIDTEDSHVLRGLRDGLRNVADRIDSILEGKQ